MGFIFNFLIGKKILEIVDKLNITFIKVKILLLTILENYIKINCNDYKIK
ncbi:hypothetical protein HMPREF1552_01724 [Leptotrichia sp. oral taxon 879 str. F0557]|nr:hypothetical protein HMPREF1552_01724 [Leptotrichia sp. oral taxon 879 str. F0557]